MKLFWLALAWSGHAVSAGAAELPLAFVRHDLSAGQYGQVTQGMGVGDVDGDGRIDLIVGGDEHLLLYRNPDFTPSLIADGFKFGGGAAVTGRDVDADGRVDVITGRHPFDDSSKRESVWFQNTLLGWVPHLLSATAYCHDVAFGDLDGDSRIDMACADLFRDELSWLAGPPDPSAEWTVHPIDERRVQGAAIADVDRDGRLDVVAGRAWYRNTPGTPPTWERIPLTVVNDEADRRFDDYAKVSVMDLDDDGRLDVFATLFADSREGQVWAFFQPADAVAEPWPALVIDPGPLFGVHSQGAGSFDGTTRPQVMVGETNIGGFGFGPNPSPEIYVYRRIGDARVSAGWERTRVDTHGTHEAQVIDLNGDGLADIAGDEENTEFDHHARDGVVSWWENRTIVPDTPPTCTDPQGCESPPTCSDPKGCEPAPTRPPLAPPTCDDALRCPAGSSCGDVARRTLVSAACLCREAGTGDCTDVVIVPRVDRRHERACTAIERAAVAPNARIMLQRVRAATRAIGRAITVVAAPSSGLPPACAFAMIEGLQVAARRAGEATR